MGFTWEKKKKRREQAFREFLNNFTTEINDYRIEGSRNIHEFLDHPTNRRMKAMIVLFNEECLAVNDTQGQKIRS